jgi:hypothetical protein
MSFIFGNQAFPYLPTLTRIASDERSIIARAGNAELRRIGGREAAVDGEEKGSFR